MASNSIDSLTRAARYISIRVYFFFDLVVTQINSTIFGKIVFLSPSLTLFTHLISIRILNWGDCTVIFAAEPFFTLSLATVLHANSIGLARILIYTKFVSFPNQNSSLNRDSVWKIHKHATNNVPDATELSNILLKFVGLPSELWIVIFSWV